jgi:hypothetical protein
LDFEKAFNKIEHNTTLLIMKHKGFGPQWLHWMHSIFVSGASSVLLNGVHVKLFIAKSGSAR